jgi:hypothetical protein
MLDNAALDDETLDETTTLDDKAFDNELPEDTKELDSAVLENASLEALGDSVLSAVVHAVSDRIRNAVARVRVRCFKKILLDRNEVEDKKSTLTTWSLVASSLGTQ